MERIADRTIEETRERFWSFVEKHDPDCPCCGGCWFWTRALRTGYGRFKIRGRYYSAHRLAYEWLEGPIPEGLTLDHTCHGADALCPGGHTCRHRRCVNTAHLEPVTMTVNLARGLSPSARPDLYPHIYPMARTEG